MMKFLPARQMLFEDAHLFFEFQRREKSTIIWKAAIQESGGSKVPDNFFDQYFDTFRKAKFRLSIIGVTGP